MVDKGHLSAINLKAVDFRGQWLFGLLSISFQPPRE